LKDSVANISGPGSEQFHELQHALFGAATVVRRTLFDIYFVLTGVGLIVWITNE
jgi:hypothetical protein